MKTITAVLVMALASATAYADDATKTTDTPKTEAAKLNKAELQVLAHYHELNLLEIDLGKTAIKKSANPAVKAYAEMLVTDHGDADKKVKALAKKMKQIVPAEKPATDAEKQEKADTKKAAAALKKLKGADFDREYLRMMVEGHDKELAKVDTKLADVQNAELAELVSGKKATLQKHADQARELQKGNAQAAVGHAHP
jgi:putative membrane protein